MSELAKYSVEWKLEGMKVPGMPEGAMDRRLTFEIDIDATDLEGATKAWYTHLDAMLGDQAREEIKTAALQWAAGRR